MYTVAVPIARRGRDVRGIDLRCESTSNMNSNPAVLYLVIPSLISKIDCTFKLLCYPRGPRTMDANKKDTKQITRTTTHGSGYSGTG